MKNRIIGCILYVCVLLCACQQEVFGAQVHQPKENVVKIELLDTHDNKKRLLYTVQQDELSFVWDAVTGFEYCRAHSEPSTEYGKLAVRIYYHDGYSDIIGMRSNRYLTPTDTMALSDYGFYLLDESDFINLFSRFIDPKLLP